MTATETLARWLLADDDLRGAARGADDLRAAVTARLLEPLTGPAEDLVIIALAAVDWDAVAARLEKPS